MMDQERYKRISELFARTIEMEPDEQDAFLLGECGDDQDLIEEVKSLLAHDKEESILGATEDLVPQDLAAGERVGPYRILEKLGEGGMGAVYLAEQEEPIRRRVALKIIKMGMDTREVVARFEAERQALAMMDHPNIARVLDAGATDRGRPYFVMEHVPGIPITAYCDKHRLNTKERLELYIPVCQAIHHAHQKAIIHRDVKPSNVLVMVQDGKPIPKVIDFGVAKAINQRLTEKTVFTEQGRLIGTPVYMSPEQAEMTGLSVDTTTDVYSLGVMLYELLVGAPPFDPRTLRKAGLEAIYRIIREEDPPKPSTRISTLGDDAARVAVIRRTEPGRLERQIRGELDWVVMRAMEKDRTRRYPSASEFAADIERYLFGEPVAAGPPTAKYKLRKFVARHKTGFGIAVASTFILVAFALSMAIQAQRIARERDHARLEAERSLLEAEALQSVLLEHPSPDEYLPRMREAIALHTESLENDKTKLALYLANQLFLLTYLYGESGNGKFLRAKEELEPQALAVLHEAVSEGDSLLLKTIDSMMRVVGGEEFEDETGTARMEAVLQLHRDALALRKATLPPGHADVIAAMKTLSSHLRTMGERDLKDSRLGQAETRLREAADLLDEARRAGAEWIDFHLRGVQGPLGEVLSRMGRYAEAEPLLLESFKNHRRDTLLWLIELYEAWGKPEEAERYRSAQLVSGIREVGAIARGSAGRSARFGERSIWLLSDSGGPWGRLTNTWAWTDDMNAGDGLELYSPGSLVTERRLLPFTAEEAAFNRDRADGGSKKQWAVLPNALMCDPAGGRTLVTYTKGFAEEGSWELDSVGTSLAVCSHPESMAVRPRVRPESTYPTLLCQGDEAQLNGEILLADGYVYFYFYRGVWIGSRAKIARVAVGRELEKGAWRYYAGEDAGWVEDPDEAIEIMKDCANASIHWNEYLGKYLAVYKPAFGSPDMAVQTAERPEGPWSPPRVIFTEKGLSSVAAHPEFSRNGGQTVYVSYARDLGWFQAETRLLEVVFR